ncbi:hypothetical protein HOLleu_26650 [Holothuria leucospilota]|uniref:Uncharacterized protein n=1 Tax=Holothuria leucospilota TaxID=206669 RepID=A0A9Q1H2N5_HOLLE|nr:hypothetical protein HOLleu_26650 [Holothuria leucospilota]
MVTFDMVTIVMCLCLVKPSLASPVMDGEDSKIIRIQKHLDEVNENLNKILSNSDSTSRCIQDLDQRLSELEKNVEKPGQLPHRESKAARPNSNAFVHSQSTDDNITGVNTNTNVGAAQERDSVTHDGDFLEHSPDQNLVTTANYQEEFQSIRDSLSRLKLPNDLKLNESKQGIRREDQQTLAVLSRCGRYTDTTLKALAAIGEISEEAPREFLENELAQIIKIQQAQIKYLQDEYANLVVQSKFDKTTSQTFRSLQRNTSGLNANALKNLKLATAISSAGLHQQTTSNQRDSSYRPTSQSSWRGSYNPGRQGFRGRGRGNNSYYNSNYNYNHNVSDVFDQFAQKGPSDHR